MCRAAATYKERNIVNETPNRPTEEEILVVEISDESLEAAAGADCLRALTQISFCTMGVCPGG
jgi:hypothetical protein